MVTRSYAMLKYCRYGIFRENFIFANCIKRHIIDVKKFAVKARLNYINKRQSDFDISRGFYFHETSHMRSFAKIKSSRKFPNLQDIRVASKLAA